MTNELASRLLREAADMHRRGAVADAATRYSQILRIDPKNVDALYFLGLAYSQLRRPTEAIDLLRKAVKIAPKHAAARTLLGRAQRDLGHADEALASFDKAIAQQPHFLEAYIDRADLLMALNQPAEAVRTYDRALSVRPDFVEGWCNRGTALEAMRRLEDAIASYDRALALRADLVLAHANRGNALAALGRHEDAVASFDRALALQPGFAEVHINRGNVLMHLKRLDEALASYNAAATIRPDMAEAAFGRGMVFRDWCRFEDAVASFDRAIAHNRSESLRGLYHAYRAEALNLLGRFPEALADVERSLELAPDDDRVLFSVSLIELRHGRWREAWPHYERRLPLKVGVPDTPLPPWPPWRGEPPNGELLVLRGEQGIGDHLLFSRFGAHLATLGHRVVLWTRPSLQPLLRTVPGLERVICDSGELAPSHLPPQHAGGVRLAALMSVPGILGITPATVPQNVPYLAAEPARVAAWRERLGTRGFKIGIAWQNAVNAPIEALRSIPLASFGTLADIPGVRLISLQKGRGEDDIATVPFHGRIETLGPGFDEGGGAFLDSAAVMTSLDLFISCDTALAHLAGGLGCPTFLALHDVSDWRWLLEGTDNPWYPATRLFRQSSPGDWSGVFARIAEAVRERAS